MDAEPKLGRKVLGSLAHVDTLKLTSCCVTTRNKYKIYGTYDDESSTKDGIYVKNYELLNAIEFQWMP